MPADGRRFGRRRQPAAVEEVGTIEVNCLHVEAQKDDLMETAEEREQRIAALRKRHLARVAEENQRMAQQAAVDRCGGCSEPKHEQDDTVTLPNGLVLSRFVTRCAAPNGGCTARVYSHLPSESPAVANRIVDWLASLSELRVYGASWLACLSSDRVLLTYRFPVLDDVAKVVATVSVEEFRAVPDPAPTQESSL